MGRELALTIVMKTTLRTGASQGDGDAAEDLPLRRAVGPCGLEHLAQLRRQASRDHDHREGQDQIQM